MSARFGEILMNRRRQMGLSIQQVANTIKIRPQIIEFFEMGDFSSMPPRGYSQGMISSYARYLGLNPREVVEAYFDDLRAYEQATDRSGGRLQDAAGYVSPRSAGATGRFMMVDSTPRSRYGQRPPQAGYVSESRSGHEPQPVSFNQRPMGELPGQTSRMDAPRIAGRGSSSRAPMPGRASSYRGGSTRASRGTYPGGAESFARGRQDMVRRPSTEQRGAYRSPYEGRGRTSSPYRSDVPGRGRGGGAPTGPSQPMILALLGAAGVIIILLLVLLFKGCTPADDAGAANGSTVPATEPTTETTDDTQKDADDDTAVSNEDGSDTTGDEGSDTDADADGDAATDGEDGDEKPKETVVTISVKEGESSWLEVRLDGQVVYGNEVYGPWEQTYTVTDSLRITANSPGSVTVTQNGESVRWDTSTSGVARISITAEPATTSDEDSDADGDAATDGSTDATNANA